jgi:hypothetical protein
MTVLFYQWVMDQELFLVLNSLCASSAIGDFFALTQPLMGNKAKVEVKSGTKQFIRFNGYKGRK